MKVQSTRELYFIDNFRDSNNDDIKILRKPPRAKFDLILFAIRFLCRRCSFSPIELGREQSSRTNHSSACAVLNSIADIYQYAWQVYEHACLFPQEVFHTYMHECIMLCVSTREYSRADMPIRMFIIMIVKCSRRGNVN